MNIRQAKKILNQISPSEMNCKAASYWNRYHRASNYIDKLYRNSFAKIRKKRGYVLPFTKQEIDDLINNAIKDNETNK